MVSWDGMRTIMHKKNLYTGLFLILSLYYLGITATAVQFLLVFNNIMTATHAPSFGIIAIFPHLLFLPIIFVIASLTFFHLSLKIRDFSPLALILAILFLAVLPYPMFRVSQLYIYPLILQFDLFRLNNTFSWWNYIAVGLGLMSAIILIINSKKFGEEGKPLQKKSKILVGTFFFLTVIPVMIFCGYLYYRSTHQKFDYEKVRNNVSYYVYQPTVIPNGRIHETVYYIPRQLLVKKEVTVQVDFNYPMNELMNGKKAGLISLKQSAVDKKFNLETFSTQYQKTIKDARAIPMQSAKNKTGLLKHKNGAYYLMFISQKNTLIVISAFYIDQKDLMSFAESLR